MENIMTDFIFSDEYHRAVEQWKLAHPIRPCTCHPDDNPPVPCPQKFCLTECLAAAPSYWDEKKKDRREEFKREDAENHERAYPDREWEHK